MPKRKQPTWEPAKKFTVKRLKPSGPKPGQSIDAFLYGKTKGSQELMDNPRTKFNDLP
jgi:hypothetical protein